MLQVCIGRVGLGFVNWAHEDVCRINRLSFKWKGCTATSRKTMNLKFLVPFHGVIGEAHRRQIKLLYTLRWRCRQGNIDPEQAVRSVGTTGAGCPWGGCPWSIGRAGWREGGDSTAGRLFPFVHWSSDDEDDVGAMQRTASCCCCCDWARYSHADNENHTACSAPLEIQHLHYFPCFEKARKGTKFLKITVVTLSGIAVWFIDIFRSEDNGRYYWYYLVRAACMLRGLYVLLDGVWRFDRQELKWLLTYLYMFCLR